MMKITVMASFKALFQHLSGWFGILPNCGMQFVTKKELIFFEPVKYFPTFCGILSFSYMLTAACLMLFVPISHFV
jgi:hypothetical protein